jgi:hypothetical protein
VFNICSRGMGWESLHRLSQMPPRDAASAELIGAVRATVTVRLSTHGPATAGLVAMPSHDRVGAPVVGTGFVPSATDLIPEWATADFADPPMPANASLLAFAADGTEVVLYTYQPEQRGWVRMVGPQFRHLLAPIREVSPEQEYLPAAANKTSRLLGTFRGEEYDAVADPPDKFRVLAMTRAARYPVETLSRRTLRGLARDPVHGARRRVELGPPEAVHAGPRERGDAGRPMLRTRGL